MLRILREPRWLALLLAVPVGVAICLLLSDWQWNRYEGRKDSNTIQSANMAQAPAPVAEVMPIGTAVSDANHWRSVTATGTYDAGAEVLVRKRPMNNSNGFWVVTPLVTTNGDVLVVNRGWVRADSDARSTPTIPPPPTGTVQVQGRVQSGTPFPNPLPTDLPVGQVSTLDVAAIGATAGPNVYPGYIDLTASNPAQQPGLTPIPAPEVSEGSHLSYSLQWIAFAIMFVIGFVLLTRREIQTRRREAELLNGPGPDTNDRDHPTGPTPAGESERTPQDSLP